MSYYLLHRACLLLIHMPVNVCVMGPYMPESMDYIAEEETHVRRKAWKGGKFCSRVQDRTC